MTPPISGINAQPTSESCIKQLSFKHLVILLLTLLTVFTAYSPALSGNFVWDDRNLIERPASIHQIQPLTSYFKQTFWNTEDHQRQNRSFYRPLVTLSYAVEWQIWDGKPFGFHLTNIFIHLFNCILVFFLALKWEAKPRAALVGMGVFGLLPRLSESVAWISGRTDTMAAFFTFGSLLIFPTDCPRVSVRTTMRILSASLLILIGLFCKEVALAGIAVLCCSELGSVVRKENTLFKTLLRLLPVFMAFLFYLWLRTMAMAGHDADGFQLSMGFLSHVSLILAAIGSYVRMAFLFFIPEFQIGSIYERSVFLIILGTLFISLLIFIMINTGLKKMVSSRRLPCAVLCFAPLLLVIHIIPLNIICLGADRFIYIPAAAFAIGLSIISQNVPQTYFRIKNSIVAAILCISLAVLFAHVEHWTTERLLFSWGCGQAPDVNTLGCLLLATNLIEDGMPEGALKAYDKVERLEKNANSQAWQNYSMPRTCHGRAQALASLGKHQDTINSLLEIQKNIESGSVSSNIQIMKKIPALLAMSYLRLGDISHAREVVQKSIIPLPGGPKISASFEKLSLNIAGPLKELDGDFRKPPAELNDISLRKTIHLARLLNDRHLLTASFVELLRRSGFSEQERLSALAYLEKSGICSLTEPLFAESGMIPERCQTVSEAVFQ